MEYNEEKCLRKKEKSEAHFCSCSMSERFLCVRISNENQLSFL